MCFTVMERYPLKCMFVYFLSSNVRLFLLQACFCFKFRILKPYMYIHWLAGFYGISTIVGYLMPNPLIYMSLSLFFFFFCTQLNGLKHFYITCTFKWIYIYDLLVNSLLVVLPLNELELICLHTIIVIVSTQLNGFNYCYITFIILFNINHLFAHN